MNNTAQFDIDEPLFPISKAARLLTISVHTLRMYEREGLLLAPREGNEQRSYSRRDLERVKCIRHAINEMKISINGIKTIYSLIPCWEVVGCSLKDRQKCQAYQGHNQPCWTYPHPGTVCDSADCRNCEVYQRFTTCGEVKELIKQVSGNK